MRLVFFFLFITSVSFSQRNEPTQSVFTGEWYSCSDADLFDFNDSVVHVYTRSMDECSVNTSILFESNSTFSISKNAVFQVFFGSQIEYQLNQKKKIFYFSVNKMIIVYSYAISDNQLSFKLNQKEMKRMNKK